MRVFRDSVSMPDGNTSIREHIRHPGAAMVVPMLENGRLIMVRQYRYALGRVMVEFPAGKHDPGEDSITTANRELLEETGYTAHEMTYLGHIHPAIGFSDEQIELYIARDLHAGKANTDHDEFLQVFETTLHEALNWVELGQITDTKTIIALYWVERYLAGRWSPPDHA